jgi:hypothetical protein
MPHVLGPIPPKTLEGSYEGVAYSDAQGNSECVEFIRQTLSAPATRFWNEGDKIKKGDLTPVPGTAIATFVNGKYPQDGSSGMHAAIYLGQNANGVEVLDQWRSQGEVRKRTIKWKPTSGGLSNDGNAFSVIEW